MYLQKTVYCARNRIVISTNPIIIHCKPISLKFLDVKPKTIIIIATCYQLLFILSIFFALQLAVLEENEEKRNSYV